MKDYSLHKIIIRAHGRSRMLGIISLILMTALLGVLIAVCTSI